MKICYLCSDLGIPIGGTKGASVHVRGMLHAFKELGHDVRVVSGGGDDQVTERVDAPVVHLQRHTTAEALKGRTDIRLQRALRHLWNNTAVESSLTRLLEQEQPDLVYERYSPFGVAGALVADKMNVPHMLEVNAPLAREGREYRNQALSDVATALEQAVFSATRLIRCVSRGLRDELQENGVAPEKTVVIPNGVDPRHFETNDKSQVTDDGRFTIGFVGSLKPWHGIDELANAFRMLATNRRFHLLVVGDGPMAGTLEQLRGEFPEQVTLVPAVPHHRIASYVHSMDIAVAPYPSLDSFYFSPLKVLEYMAAARPIVASGIGQLQELIEDGRNGVLVPPGEVAALAVALQRLADEPDLAQELGRCAAEDVRRQHTWTQRAATILDHAKEFA